jgi:hypothetical protein
MNQGTQAAGAVRHEKEDTRVIHATGNSFPDSRTQTASPPDEAWSCRLYSDPGATREYQNDSSSKRPARTLLASPKQQRTTTTDSFDGNEQRSRETSPHGP